MPDIEPETTIHRVTVFDGKLISVRKETVRVRGGTTTREIVVHPEVIAVLPVLDDGRLVLVRQFRKAAERILLEVVAGGIDDGETPEEAARREMIEETGYHVDRLEPIRGFYTSPGFTTEFMHLFRATGLTPGEPTEETDQIEVVVLTREEALERVRTGEIADAKTILALMYIPRV